MERLPIVGCIKPFTASVLLFSVSQAKHCGYRVYSTDRRAHNYAHRLHEAAEVGVKDCTWGCCMDQTYDVCCPFPLEIVVVGVISCISLAIVIAVVASLLKYLISRWRATNHGHTTTCKHGNYATLVYPCQSTVLHQNYIQVDSASPSSHTDPNGSAAAKAPRSRSQDEITHKTNKLPQLIYRTL